MVAAWLSSASSTHAWSLGRVGAAVGVSAWLCHGQAGHISWQKSGWYPWLLGFCPPWPNVARETLNGLFDL